MKIVYFKAFIFSVSVSKFLSLITYFILSSIEDFGLVLCHSWDKISAELYECGLVIDRFSVSTFYEKLNYLTELFSDSSSFSD